MKQPEIKRIVVLGEFDDGHLRQFLIKDLDGKTTTAIMQTILMFEGAVKVCETPLDGIEIVNGEKP